MTVQFVSSGQPAVIEIVRSGVVEGHHYGSVVARNADGTTAWSVGDVHRPVLPRSSNKPLQALAMLREGLQVPPTLLALAGASHSGESFHVQGVREMLAGVGLDETALRCPPDWPVQSSVAEEWMRGGGSRERVLMNCSGKHAAMLATCVRRGWRTDTYLDPEHPLQKAIRAVVEEMTGEQAHVATDGCGAPLLSTSLNGLARAFSLLARGLDGTGSPSQASVRVAEAMRAHPEWLSGSSRDERLLHDAVPGLIGKAGAEACYAVALPDGRAVALKVDDGAARARPVVMAAALRQWRVDTEPGVDTAALRRTGTHELLGAGLPVGELRPVISTLLAD